MQKKINSVAFNLTDGSGIVQSFIFSFNNTIVHRDTFRDIVAVRIADILPISFLSLTHIIISVWAAIP